MWDWIWLAMVHHRLGNADEARQWLDKACSWIDQSIKTQSWTTRIELQLLRREAEELMPQTPEDKKAPTNADAATSKPASPETMPNAKPKEKQE